MLLPPCIWLCILYPVIERRIGIIEFDILVGPRQTNIGAELARSITFFSLQLVFHTIFTDYFYRNLEQRLPFPILAISILFSGNFNSVKMLKR